MTERSGSAVRLARLAGATLAALACAACGNSFSAPSTTVPPTSRPPSEAAGATSGTSGEATSVPVPTTSPQVSPDISDEELTAVGLDYFEAYWKTSKAGDSTVCLIPDAGAAFCQRQETGQIYHLVRLTGLVPGRHYRYWLISDGMRAQTIDDLPDPAQPSVAHDAMANRGQFTTLTLPSGRHVADVALLSDLHIGENCSGQALGSGGQSIPPCTVYPGHPAGDDQHSNHMLAGAVAQIRKLDPALVLVLGDLTNNGGYDDMASAKMQLDRLALPYAVLRGNHDRPAQNAMGEAMYCGPALDCFSTVFRPDNTMRVQPVAVATHGVRFLMLDASDTSGLGDLTDAAQQAWTTEQLQAHPKQRTFILSHEPAGYYSNATTYVPQFGVSAPRGGQWLHSVVSANPQISATIGGHTHRNLLGFDPDTGRVPWIEIGANKEYAAGFSVLRLYEGGFVREFHRTDCYADDNFCRQWTSLSRGQNYGLQFDYMLGQLHSRAFTYVDDCSHNTPMLPSLPNRVDGDTGQDTADCRANVTYPQ